MVLPLYTFGACQVPFFLTGESLGGGLALLTGLTLNDRKVIGAITALHISRLS